MKIYQVSTLEIAAIVGLFTASILDAKSADNDKQFNLFIGAGFHKENFDCPEVCFNSDSLVIAQIKYKPSKNTAIIGTHISAPFTRERGRGFNGVFGGWDYSF